MKICENCGHENWDYRTTCEKCNMSIYEKGAAANRPSFSKYTLAEKHVEERGYIDTGCTTAAKVFMILATVGAGLTLFLFAIIWCGYSLLPSDLGIYEDIIGSSFTVYLIVAFVKFIFDLRMTIAYFQKTARYKEKVGVGFKVCTLLLVDFIAGLLMLLDKRDE